MKKIGILGNGLLGGSIALAIAQRTDIAPFIYGRNWDSQSWSLDLMEKEFISKIFQTNSLKQTVSDAELLIFCIPVGAMSELLEQVLEFSLHQDVLITDVGSVKKMVHASLGKRLTAMGIDFVGSHPMSGGERTGRAFSHPNLFANHPVILTNDEEVSLEKVQFLEDFWKKLGASRIVSTSSKEHDDWAALISHLPHLLASLQVLLTENRPEAQNVIGNGFLDMTRVASGNPEMWTEILLSNREPLIKYLKKFQSHLGFCIEKLNSGEREEILFLLKKAVEEKKKII